MKKITTILLASIFALSLFGCGDSNGDSGGSDVDLNGDSGGSDVDSNGDSGGSDVDLNGDEGGSDGEATEICKIDPEIVNPIFDEYFLFKGAGMINDPENASNDLAGLITMGLKLENYPEKTLEQTPSPFFRLHKDEEKGDAVELIVMGDPTFETKGYETLVSTLLPISLIDSLKEKGETKAPFSTQVLIRDVKRIDDAILKICIIGTSKLAYDKPEGKIQVCYDKNKSFAIGEVVRFGINARLTADVDEIVEILNLNSKRDLCRCVKGDGEVDCPEESDSDDADVESGDSDSDDADVEGGDSDSDSAETDVEGGDSDSDSDVEGGDSDSDAAETDVESGDSDSDSDVE